MENVTHTPGPWRIEFSEFTELPPIIYSADGYLVAQIGETDQCGECMPKENDRANGRLISAAPELLAALKECLSCEFAVTDKAAIAKAEAAIAKVEAH